MCYRFTSIQQSVCYLKKVSFECTVDTPRDQGNVSDCTGRGPIIAKYQLSPICTLLASAREFSGHCLQTTIINGDKADSKILHLYLG